ncbi:MAG TPA: hypothetical protein VFQ32_00630, partial [Ktedonobacterales bacterium]|nr:hypothetical protein [Ktedonobacterales bacterium]
VENVNDSDVSALLDFLTRDGNLEEVNSPWRPISDGRGMATVSQIGGADQPLPTGQPTADSKLNQNGKNGTQNGARDS